MRSIIYAQHSLYIKFFKYFMTSEGYYYCLTYFVHRYIALHLHNYLDFMYQILIDLSFPCRTTAESYYSKNLLNYSESQTYNLAKANIHSSTFTECLLQIAVDFKKSLASFSAFT